jgi:hypothetical protein
MSHIKYMLHMEHFFDCVDVNLSICFVSRFILSMTYTEHIDWRRILCGLKIIFLNPATLESPYNDKPQGGVVISNRTEVSLYRIFLEKYITFVINEVKSVKIHHFSQKQ